MAGTSPAMTVRERLWVTLNGRWYQTRSMQVRPVALARLKKYFSTSKSSKLFP